MVVSDDIVRTEKNAPQQNGKYLHHRPRQQNRLNNIDLATLMMDITVIGFADYPCRPPPFCSSFVGGASLGVVSTG